MKSSLRIYFLIFIFLIFSTYNTKYKKENLSIFFPVREIIIEDYAATNVNELRTDLNFLKNSSLIFLNDKKILEVVKKHDFISNIKLKKQYPNTLRLKIIEKIPIATQIVDRKKFYITRVNEKINFIDLKIYEDLPSIFGAHRNLNNFYNNLEKNNFQIDQIKSFYYFEVDRWDIVLKNEKIIKLPEKNYITLLPRINLMLQDSNLIKYKVYDFRIKDQLILK